MIYPISEKVFLLTSDVAALRGERAVAPVTAEGVSKEYTQSARAHPRQTSMSVKLLYISTSRLVIDGLYDTHVAMR